VGGRGEGGKGILNQEESVVEGIIGGVLRRGSRRGYYIYRKERRKASFVTLISEEQKRSLENETRRRIKRRGGGRGEALFLFMLRDNQETPLVCFSGRRGSITNGTEESSASPTLIKESPRWMKRRHSFNLKLKFMALKTQGKETSSSSHLQKKEL